MIVRAGAVSGAEGLSLEVVHISWVMSCGSGLHGDAGDILVADVVAVRVRVSLGEDPEEFIGHLRVAVGADRILQGGSGTGLEKVFQHLIGAVVRESDRGRIVHGMGLWTIRNP